MERVRSDGDLGGAPAKDDDELPTVRRRTETVPFRPSRALRGRVDAWRAAAATAVDSPESNDEGILRGALTVPTAPLSLARPCWVTTAAAASAGAGGPPFHTLFVYDDRFCGHFNASTTQEPERPARVSVTRQHLAAVGLLVHPAVEQLSRLPPRGVRADHLRLVHSDAHISFVEGTSLHATLSRANGVAVGHDLYASEGTARAAKAACGAVVEAALRVCGGGGGSAMAAAPDQHEPPAASVPLPQPPRNAFCLVRPPGHHCSCTSASGFCFFNNVAVAARAAQAEFPETIKRVMILDWDVHHGDGTQRIFYNDPSVCVFSIHQHGFKRPQRVRYTAPTTAQVAHKAAQYRSMQQQQQQEMQRRENEQRRLQCEARGSAAAVARPPFPWTTAGAQEPPAVTQAATFDDLMATLEGSQEVTGPDPATAAPAPPQPLPPLEHAPRSQRTRKPVSYKDLDAELRNGTTSQNLPGESTVLAADGPRGCHRTTEECEEVCDRAADEFFKPLVARMEGKRPSSTSRGRSLGELEETTADSSSGIGASETEWASLTATTTTSSASSSSSDDGNERAGFQGTGWNNLPDFRFSRDVPLETRCLLQRDTFGTSRVAIDGLLPGSAAPLQEEPSCTGGVRSCSSDGGRDSSSSSSASDDGWDSGVDEPYYPATGHRWLVGGDGCDEGAERWFAAPPPHGRPTEHAAAQGKNINVPWPSTGMGDVEYLMVLQELFVPIAREFKPDLLLISCGFDCAANDLLGSMCVSPSGFYAMTRLASRECPRVVVALEGGYNIKAVALSAEGTMRGLVDAAAEASAAAGRVDRSSTGSTPRRRPARDPKDRSTVGYCHEIIEKVRETQRPFWGCF